MPGQVPAHAAALSETRQDEPGTGAVPDTAAELSCRAYKTLLVFYERQYGRSSDEVIKRAGSLSRDYLLDEANFTSCAYAQRLADELVRASGDPDFMWKASLAWMTPESLGFVYYLFKALGTPLSALQKVVEVAPGINRVGTFVLDEVGTDFARLRYVSRVREHNRHLCRGRMGQIAALPTVWNLPPATIEETACQVEGAPACSYAVKWVEPAYPREALLPALGGLGLGLALNWLGVNAGPELPLGLLGIGAGTGIVRYYRKELRRRDHQLESQTTGLLRSLEDLEKRHREISELNQTLEQKVADRTKELTLTGAKLQAALQKQLELDRAKTQFFQNISHELRTPLTLILAPLESISAEESLDPRAKGQLDIMRRSAVRLLAMINSLLDLSRLDAGKMRLSLDDLDAALGVRQLVESAQGLAKQRGIDLRYAGPERLEKIPLDADKFDKCVMNLVSNALKFTSPGEDRRAEVEVSASVEDGRLVVRVRDSGIGIPPDELENIFARFHQVDSSDERRYGGTGIGLALVKELVEYHCGTVSVESTPGVGSTFSLSFPTTRDAYPPERLDRRRGRAEVMVDRRSEGEAQKLSQLIANPADLALADIAPVAGAPVVAPAPALPGSDTRPRVLVADDNRDMLAYLSTILGREYEIITASDGEEALELAQRHLPQCIVSDVMMPRKNGYALVKDLKKDPRTRSIPIILVTAKADVHQKIAGIEYGADDYLTKPFNFLELRARIRQLLRARGLERSLAEKNEYLEKLNFDLVLSKKEVFLQTIEALAFALEAKDSYTHGHSRRVSLLSTELAREMSLSEIEIERVRIAAVLHDIGKLGIPESILKKEGRLTPEEQDIIQKHPEIGFHILENVRELAEVNRCILLHHEKFDGSGYPRHARAHDIPLESRIIAVTDTYDAMTSDRPYRKGLGHARAIEELRNFSGSQFDPEVVRYFLRRYEQESPRFPAFPSVLSKLRA